MKAENFIYWLQGYFEISNTNALSPLQVEIIKNHLALVFVHEIDHSYSSDPKVKEQLQQIHDGDKPPVHHFTNTEYQDKVAYRC